MLKSFAGTVTAGIPHGAIIADKMNLPFAYIRSKPKDYGNKRQIEERVAKGQKMVVIEALISTGGSVLSAVAAAQNEGAEVLGVLAIFTYEFEEETHNLESASVSLSTLTSYTDLIEVAHETDQISKEELELLQKFKQNQENWQD